MLCIPYDMTFLTKLKEIKQAGKVKIGFDHNDRSSKKDSREDKEREEVRKGYSKKTHISPKMLLNLCFHYQ